MVIKKSFKILQIFVVLVLTVFLSSCVGEVREEPQIKVLAGDKEIKVIYYGDRYNENLDDIEKRIKYVLEDQSWEDIPYFEFGEEITIETENFEAKEIQISDYILNKDGSIRYGDEVVDTFEIIVEDGKGKFILNDNIWAGLSSNSHDYEPGNTIRGLVFNIEIDNSTFKFAIILRTDWR